MLFGCGENKNQNLSSDSGAARTTLPPTTGWSLQETKTLRVTLEITKSDGSTDGVRIFGGLLKQWRQVVYTEGAKPEDPPVQNWITKQSLALEIPDPLQLGAHVLAQTSALLADNFAPAGGDKFQSYVVLMDGSSQTMTIHCVPDQYFRLPMYCGVTFSGGLNGRIAYESF